MHENFEWGRLDGHANATVRYSDGIQEKKKGQQANKEQLRKGQIISPDPRTIGRGVPI